MELFKKPTMKSNEILQKDVQDAIKWDPLLMGTQIGVVTNNGIVTLTGTIDSYARKAVAEDVVKAVTGVKAIIEKMDVDLSSMGRNLDKNIAEGILDALDADWKIPNSIVKVKVEDGWVTLDGELHWNYQKEAAMKVVKNIAGIKGITNNISIKSTIKEVVEKQQIADAFRRNSSINDDDITIEVQGIKVVLNGTVKSWYQRDKAEQLAWNAPGILSVDNELAIENDRL